MNKQKIMTIDVKALFFHFAKKADEQERLLIFDITKETKYRAVVKQETMMEECPLFYQFYEVMGTCDKTSECLLYDKLVILDFGDIFLPETNAKKKMKKQILQDQVKDIMEKGFVLRFENRDVHLFPFDKSGNMSRNARITFIDKKYIIPLNQRLNLDIEFENISVVLSKYYAYRGLYLSTSKRVPSNQSFIITAETLVVMPDQRLKENVSKRGACKDEHRPILGFNYERGIPIETATEDEDGHCEFTPSKTEKIEYTDIPFDGQGLIIPAYSEYMNKELGIEGATSYQIRMPFVKGMVHQVDVMAFLNEYDADGINRDEPYKYKDAFGIERDLKKAQILITESMFKCKGWLCEYCKIKGIQDPMQYYCDKIQKYQHALYVSGTNLQYGHSEYTHLSYQSINTLAFTQEEFEHVMEKHNHFIQEPLDYLQKCDKSMSVHNEDKENWRRAVLTNEIWKNDIYIKGQLKNIQNSLLTKQATGKILVEGQTRYLCRDLLPLLACLLKDEGKVNEFWQKFLWQQFYMPFGENEGLQLKYSQYYTFFRNPHLSRNEQCIMRPFVSTQENDYVQRKNVNYEKYNKYLKIYHKYFSHLTGVVMVPRGSVLPLCLGGADFDGDLVSVVYDQNVTEAVKRVAYQEENGYYKRSMPVVKIPSQIAKKKKVPAYVPYQHIYDTFYNRIGQISNLAISIGQAEYGVQTVCDVKEKADSDTKKLTCSNCTLLTGLEIDAAKNGIHPNLEGYLANAPEKCSYLQFLEQYKKLRSEKEFKADHIKVEKRTISSKECIVVSAKDCKTEAEFSIPKQGTYINQLPILYYENYTKMKKGKGKKGVVSIDVSDGLKNISEEQKILLESFQQACIAVMNLHFFYDSNFLNILRKEKSKGFYAPKNMVVLIDQMYDQGEAERIQEVVVPALRNKIEPYILKEISAKQIHDRTHRYQWQFQSFDRREEVLEKIIGNGFEVSILTEEEKNLLCHFHWQGYKFLWFFIDAIYGPRIESFDNVKEKLAEKAVKYSSVELESLERTLEKHLRRYYENNAINTSEKLYHCCLDKLKEIIENYSDLGDFRMAALYEVTTKSQQKKFFWDAFEWEKLETFVKEVGKC